MQRGQNPVPHAADPSGQLKSTIIHERNKIIQVFDETCNLVYTPNVNL
jgi:hypothetical protein